MIYLNPNTTDQRFVVTLKEKWKDFDDNPDSYLLELRNVLNSEIYYVIPIVLTDNDRYTQLRIETDNDDPENGEIELLETGEYSYTIYGQIGTTNLDPDDTDVIGVYEVGTCRVADVALSQFVDETTIPETFIDQ